MNNDDNNDEKIEKKEIEIITGDGSDLNISPVYEHIPYDDSLPSNRKKQNIVIPKGSSDKKKE